MEGFRRRFRWFLTQFGMFFRGVLGDLFFILFFFSRKDKLRHRLGLLSGIFMIGYGVSRIFIEFFRSPDPQIGFFMETYTMGQLLSVPLIIIGVYLVLSRMNFR